MLGTTRKTALLGSASAVALLVAAAPTQAQTEVEVSGYVKGDLIYDIDGGTIGDTANMSAIPLEGQAKDELSGHFRAHARQTRFRIQTSTDTAFGDLKTYIEGDFFGAGGNENVSNSTSFRLRHAYGSLGPLLVGQTWSNFTRFHYPATVDFFGPQGALFKRQGQLRYTFDASPNLQIAVSAENSENPQTSPLSAETSLTGSVDRIPDFVVMADYNAGGTSVSVGGILGKVYTEVQDFTTSCDDGVVTPGFPKCKTEDDDDTRWGVHLGVSQQVLGRDTVYGEITYGEGIGSYMNGLVPDTITTTTINLVTGATTANVSAVKIWGYDVGFTHVWSDTAESNVVWGQYMNEDADKTTAGPNSLQRTQSLHVNYMWHPVPRVTLGLEGIYGTVNRKNTSPTIRSNSNDHFRVQFGG
ncbi:MAG: hypothetical protein GWN09_01345, partial [Gammaproteobacteria bacterium]|nr:hypothetical protein [Gammaproteobacteria bacterium]